MSEINMNEEVVMVVEDATVITTPIDDTLTISGDYEFIGLRSKTGALYIESIVIEWAE